MEDLLRNENKTLFHMDGNEQGKLKKVENMFMELDDIRYMNYNSDLIRFYTKVADYYMQVSTLKHIIKHFEEDGIKEKIDLLEDVLNYKNNGYSYIVYNNIDKRFTLDGIKVNVHKRFIQVLKGSVLYEIATIEKVESTKKTYDDITQVSSYYKVDPTWVDRHKKLEYSDIIEHHFNNDSEQYFIFTLTHDKRLKIDKPIELIESKSFLGAELMRITGLTGIDMDLAIKEEKEVEVLPPKLDSEVLEVYLESMKGKLSTQDIVKIFETNTIPCVNLPTAMALATNKGVIEIGGLLYTVLSIMINYEKDGVHLKCLYACDKHRESVMNILLDQVIKFNDFAGRELLVIEDECLFEKEKINELEQ